MIPDVTGLDGGAARALLADVGLRPVVRTEPSQSIADGHATRTYPPAGTRVDRGALVRLLVSSGPAAVPVTTPTYRDGPAGRRWQSSAARGCARARAAKCPTP